MKFNRAETLRFVLVLSYSSALWPQREPAMRRPPPDGRGGLDATWGLPVSAFTKRFRRGFFIFVLNCGVPCGDAGGRGLGSFFGDCAASPSPSPSSSPSPLTSTSTSPSPSPFTGRDGDRPPEPTPSCIIGLARLTDDELSGLRVLGSSCDFDNALEPPFERTDPVRPDETPSPPPFACTCLFETVCRQRPHVERVSVKSVIAQLELNMAKRRAPKEKQRPPLVRSLAYLLPVQQRRYPAHLVCLLPHAALRSPSSRLPRCL